MSRLTRFLLEERPITRQQLDDLHTNDPAFRDLCGEYDNVIDRIDALEADGDSPSEASRLEHRRDALRDELLALIDRIHH